MKIPEGVKVLGFRALIQLDRITADGVVIPETIMPEKTEGTVVIVGDPKILAHGAGTSFISIPVKVGDRVWVSGHGAPPRTFNGCKDENGEDVLYLLVSCEDIFTIVPEASRIIVPEAQLRGLQP